MSAAVKAKVYPLSNDLMFKHIFGTNENIRFTKYLLEMGLNYPKEYLNSLKIINGAKLTKENIQNKSFEADIIIELTNDKIINLEMYNHPSKSSGIKSEMYVCRLFSNQLRRGNEYDKAKEVIQYNFIKNGSIKRDDNIVTFTLKDKGNNMYTIKDYIKIYDINIDYKEDGVKEVKNIIKFMNAEDEKEMKEIAGKDEVIEDMFQEMCAFSEEDFATPSYDREGYLMAVGRDHGREEGFKKGRKEGEAKGFKEGKKQQLIDIVKSMITNNMSTTDIAKITKISIEEISSIKEKNK